MVSPGGTDVDRLGVTGAAISSGRAVGLLFFLLSFFEIWDLMFVL